MISHYSLDNLGENDVVGQGVTIRIGRYLVQIPQGTRLGLGSQPRYKATGDLWVEIVKTQS